MSVPVSGQYIEPDDCLGDSRITINNNTFSFQNGINTLNTNLINTNTSITNLNTIVTNLSTSILQVSFNTPLAQPYTITASDLGKTILMNFSTVNSVRLPNTLPIGFTVSVMQIGTGQTSFAATGTGTVTRHPDNFTKIYKQWAVATAVYVSNNTWVLLGDLTA